MDADRIGAKILDANNKINGILKKQANSSLGEQKKTYLLQSHENKMACLKKKRSASRQNNLNDSKQLEQKTCHNLSPKVIQVQNRALTNEIKSAIGCKSPESDMRNNTRSIKSSLKGSSKHRNHQP
jgi:hypothetical protein